MTNKDIKVGIANCFNVLNEEINLYGQITQDHWNNLDSLDKIDLSFYLEGEFKIYFNSDVASTWENIDDVRQSVELHLEMKPTEFHE